MPDVTGGPPPQLGAVVGAAPGPEEAQVSVGQVGKAPDILRTEPLLSPASGTPSLVPSLDRTKELTEEDVEAEAGTRRRQFRESTRQFTGLKKIF